MPAQISIDATFTSATGKESQTMTISRAIVGGWTGRDKAALQHHIEELAKIGVQAP